VVVGEVVADEFGPAGFVDPAVAAGRDEFQQGVGADLVGELWSVPAFVYMPLCS
jgi:hypothetical protein